MNDFVCFYILRHVMYTFFDGYCSNVQGLLDWFEVDLGFTELSFIQIDLCVLCVLVDFFYISRHFMYVNALYRA